MDNIPPTLDIPIYQYPDKEFSVALEVEFPVKISEKIKQLANFDVPTATQSSGGHSEHHPFGSRT